MFDPKLFERIFYLKYSYAAYNFGRSKGLVFNYLNL